jgi:hypothetical protein
VVVKDWTEKTLLKNFATSGEKLGLYLEGSIGMPFQADDVVRFEKEVINAKEAGAVIL